MNHTLETDSIQLAFGLRQVLTDVYIKCETGKITGLLGRNGQGKTCLMNLLYGTRDAQNQSVRFDGKTIFHAFKRKDLVSYLPQFNFIPKGLTLKRIFKDFQLDFASFERDFPEFISKSSVSLKRLFGGERRLIEAYIILKSDSKFILVDEPFTHIMPLHIEKLKEILSKENSSKGILVTDHICEQITDISDTLYVLTDGKTYLIKNLEDIHRLGYAKI